MVFGAGGAAKAVAGALARSSVKGFYVTDRFGEKAVELTKLIRKHHPRVEVEAVSADEAVRLLPSCGWVIQATPVGLKAGDPSPLSLKTVKPGTWVMDLIYHHETAFLREAGRKGLWRTNGLGMLLNQGALSFERWTGRKAPVEVMRRALTAGLRSS